MALLPAVSGTEPETRPLGSVSLSFQTRPIERPNSANASLRIGVQRLSSQSVLQFSQLDLSDKVEG
ncbi:hypothetical protein B2G51_01075 [Leptospira santarosai]|nr:hypothetical protein B2G51_01075 [Leptospira santarosai]